MPAAAKHFLDELDRIHAEGLTRIAAAATADALMEVRNALVGRKSGRLSMLLRELPSLDEAARREAGARANATRDALQSALEHREQELARVAPAARALDLTMPGRPAWVGAAHPVTLVEHEIIGIFRELGFTVALGPDAETEWYNFGALNFPADHPAMDMHDTLYLESGALLRTHTSPVQIRTLQRWPPPIRIVAPGTVYRRDFFDASHAPAFAQIEGLAIDEGVSFVDLKATLTHFANRFFGATRTRFRPSYFPFTEPSAEMDVRCLLCGGSGCGACKQTGWMEILGAGMVHPSVLELVGVDSERYTGWAFGMGPGRMAMLRYGLPDIRLFYETDVRFLEQVAR
jgi:phenylalanyl-tRNA synthetase alpha chain